MALASHLAKLLMAGNKVRFLVMTLAVAGATLMVGFQLSLLHGFIDAAALIATRSGADLWVVPKGLKAIEFADYMDIGLVDVVRSDPAVRRADELLVGMAPMRTAHGEAISLVIVGVPRGGASRFPVPANEATLPGEEAVYDVSNRALIDPALLGGRAEVRRIPLRLVAEQLHLPSFFGAPLTFVRPEAARAILGLAPSETSFVMTWLRDGEDPDAVAKRLGDRLENVEVLPVSTLAGRVASFWLLQTGAGGGFLLAAALGLFIGALTISQLLWINVLETRHIIAGLLVLGIPAGAIRRALSLHGLVIGLVGGIVGVILTVPTVYVTSVTVVPWIGRPLGTLAVLAVGAAIVGWLAAQPPALRAMRIDPGLALRTA